MPESSPNSSTEPLWDFAVRTYALPGVATLCLRLQDQDGLDVNVVLAVLWLAERGLELDDASLVSLLEAIAPARARVEQLRTLRRAVGSDREHDPRWQATYEHLKAAELAAERVELSCIEEAVAHLVSGPADADHRPPTLARLALRRYAERVGARSSEAILDELVALVWPGLRV